jgi:hypothetical protein
MTTNTDQTVISMEEKPVVTNTTPVDESTNPPPTVINTVSVDKTINVQPVPVETTVVIDPTIPKSEEVKTPLVDDPTKVQPPATGGPPSIGRDKKAAIATVSLVFLGILSIIPSKLCVFFVDVYSHNISQKQNRILYFDNFK